MRVIPVLDVKQEQVVRGVAGRRHQYRPVISRLTSSADPRAVAQAIRAHFGLSTLYLADLDAIGGGAPGVALYERLAGDGVCLWVDAGLHEASDAEGLLCAGVAGVVAGFESLAGPPALRQLCQTLQPEQILFSLDLKDGRLFGPVERWGTIEPREVARLAIEAGVRRLIVLDLARVGCDTGTGTEALCRDLRAAHPEVELIAGGGIRGREDIQRLAEAGVQAVLVASALHDGRLNREDLHF